VAKLTAPKEKAPLSPAALYDAEMAACIELARDLALEVRKRL
jgi:hypothetical protein